MPSNSRAFVPHGLSMVWHVRFWLLLFERHRKHLVFDYLGLRARFCLQLNSTRGIKVLCHLPDGLASIASHRTVRICASVGSNV